jgi:hypothetical protein
VILIPSLNELGFDVGAAYPPTITVYELPATTDILFLYANPPPPPALVKPP